jgi:hypothetical protein
LSAKPFGLGAADVSVIREVSFETSESFEDDGGALLGCDGQEGLGRVFGGVEFAADQVGGDKVNSGHFYTIS